MNVHAIPPFLSEAFLCGSLHQRSCTGCCLLSSRCSDPACIPPSQTAQARTVKNRGLWRASCQHIPAPAIGNTSGRLMLDGSHTPPSAAAYVTDTHRCPAGRRETRPRWRRRQARRPPPPPPARKGPELPRPVPPRHSSPSALPAVGHSTIDESVNRTPNTTMDIPCSPDAQSTDCCE